MKGKKKADKKWTKPKITVLSPDSTAGGVTPGTKDKKVKSIYYYS